MFPLFFLVKNSPNSYSQQRGKVSQLTKYSNPSSNPLEDVNSHLRSGQITFGFIKAERRSEETFETREHMLEGVFFGGQKVREVGRYIIGLTKGLFFKGVVQEGMSQYYNPEK